MTRLYMIDLSELDFKICSICGYLIKSGYYSEEKEKYYIFAMKHSDHVDPENPEHKEGEYVAPNRGIESAQKYAIESYCKNVLNKVLPVTKIKRFACTKDQLSAVNLSGDTVQFVD